jgi:hypothetical protein
MPWVWFEPTIPAFKRAKTVHASDLAATVTGTWYSGWGISWFLQSRSKYFGIIPRFRLQPLPSEPFPIQHSSVICNLSTDSIVKQPTKVTARLFCCPLNIQSVFQACVKHSTRDVGHFVATLTSINAEIFSLLLFPLKFPWFKKNPRSCSRQGWNTTLGRTISRGEDTWFAWMITLHCLLYAQSSSSTAGVELPRENHVSR